MLVKVWAKKLGTKIKVLNKRGASGRIGFDYFRTQPQDGTVILTTNIATTGIMYASQKPDWKWEDTVYHLGVFGVDPGAIFVLKDSPFKSIKDVIAAGQKKTTVFALSSWRSTENMTIHQLMAQKKASYQVIPIGGGGDLVTPAPLTAPSAPSGARGSRKKKSPATRPPRAAAPSASG